MAPRADPFEDELRRGLYGGLLASFWASCGWLAWLFVQAVRKEPAAMLGPFVGVLVGFVAHFVEHYREVARFESEGGDWSEDEESGEPRPEGFASGLGTRLVPFVLLFVTLACEHVLGDLLTEYLVPFLASLATLFPVGAVFALAFNRDSEIQKPVDAIMRGLLVGLGASVIAALVQWAMGGDVDLLGVFGWWTILGLGYSLAAFAASLTPLRAVWGAFVAAALLLLCSLPNTYYFLVRLPLAVTRPVAVVSLLAGGALDAPDLPAQSWLNAEKAIEGERPSADRESALGKRLADWIGYEPPKPAAAPTLLAPPVGRLVLPPFEPEAVRERRLLDERRDKLGSELVKGWDSGLVRSLVVLLLFSLGLGLSPRSEESLRPPDYPSTRTARNDRTVALMMLALIVVACLLVRYPFLAPDRRP